MSLVINEVYINFSGISFLFLSFCFATFSVDVEMMELRRKTLEFSIFSRLKPGISFILKQFDRLQRIFSSSASLSYSLTFR